MTKPPPANTRDVRSPIRGWCPRGARPMWAADGALIRLRLPGNRIRAGQLAALVPIARRHAANGVMVTRRAKLELRGVAEPEAAIAELGRAGLLETGPAADVPDVLVLADQHDDHGAHRLDESLRDRLSRVGSIQRLADKFLIVIDGGGPFSAPALSADIRLDAIGDGRWRLGLAGGRFDAAPAAELGAAAVGEAVAGIIEKRLMDTRAERLRGLSDTALRDFLSADAPANGPVPTAEPRAGLGYDDALGWRVRFVFGVLSIDALAVLAEVIGDASVGLLPDRRLVLPKQAWIARDRLYQHDAIDDDADPRNGLSACIGRMGCRWASTDTRADALALAARAPEIARRGLHVSGCAKGCARRAASSATLVGRHGRYDLIRDGAPSDAPHATGLTWAEAGRALTPRAGKAGGR